MRAAPPQSMHFLNFLPPRTVALALASAIFAMGGAAASAAEFPVPPAANWSQTFAALPEAAAYSVARTDGGYIVAGTRWDPDGGAGTWGVLVRLDTAGNLVDSATYAAESDRTQALAVTPVYGDGGVLTGYVIAGTRDTAFSEDGHDYYDPWVWLARVDTALDPSWQFTYGTPFPDRGNSVIQDGTGFLVGGWEGLGPITPSGTGYLVRTDGSGVASWEHRALVPDSSTWWLNGEVNDLHRTADGGLIVATNSGVVKTDNGAPPTVVWESGADSYEAVKELADGYIAVGHTEVAETDETVHKDLLLTRFNAAGVQVWTATFGRPKPVLGATGTNDYGADVAATSDGGFAVVGTTGSFAWHGGSDLWLLKTDANGVLEWDLALGDAGNDYGHSLVEAPDGALVVAGSVTWEGSRRMWTASIGQDLVAPVPSFTFAPGSPVSVEEAVSFDGNASYDPDGVVVNWDWDYGDGHSGTGDTDSHVFVQPAGHTVTLYVTDDSGIRRSTSRSLTANELQVQWERFYGANYGYGYDMVAAPDGGFVVGGIYSVTSYGNLWVLKVDSRGKLVWQKTYADAISPGSTEAALGVSNAHDGGYILAGFRDRTPPNTTGGGALRDVWLLKVNDADGSKAWEQHFDGGGYDEARDVQQTFDNGYIITGVTAPSEASSDYNTWLIRTDQFGNLDWDSVLDDPSGDRSIGLAVTPSSDGGYVVTGELVDLDIYSDSPVVTVKTDSTGNEMWRRKVPASARDSQGDWVAETADGGYVVGSTLDIEATLIKYTSSGAQEWLEAPGTDYVHERVGGGALCPGRGFVLAGHVIVEDINDDLLVTRTEEDGTLAWERIFTAGEELREEGQAVAALADGSYVVLTAVSGGGPGKTWLMKLGPNSPPEGVSFDYSPSSPQAGSPITFQASASDTDGTVESYEWNFMDGSFPLISTSTSQVYTFNRAGTYDVILTAVDDSGGEGVYSASVTVAEAGSIDLCPDDPDKTVPGVCGCGVPDTDSDLDGTFDCLDGCPTDGTKTAPGVCGCGVADTDTDGDGSPDCVDACPGDGSKADPGTCGCGVADSDGDGDGVLSCLEGCPADPDKTDPGVCGCGVADVDGDLDGVLDCLDGCPLDGDKVAPGVCGCGVADLDTDGDGALDCEELGHDGNDDGTDDSTQPHVCSLPTYDDPAEYVTLAAESGTTMSSADAVANPSPADTPAGADFGYGFFAFTVSGIPPGGSTTLTLHLPAGAAPTTYYKHGPTPDDPSPHWYEFLYDGSTGAEIAGDVITLHFVDGLRGDDDLDATNGMITDAGGPALVTAPLGDGGGGGGGGCFIDRVNPFHR